MIFLFKGFFFFGFPLFIFEGSCPSETQSLQSVRDPRGKGAAREPEPKPRPPESAVPRTALAPAPPTPPASPAPASPTPAATPKPAVPSTTAVPVPKMVANGKGKVAEVTWTNNGNYSDPRVEPKMEKRTFAQKRKLNLEFRNCRKFLLLQDGIIEQAFGNLT